MLNRFQKYILSLVLLLFVLFFVHQYFFSTTSIWELPQLTVNLRAKEVCSCLFVQKLTEEFCQKSTEHGVPFGKTTVNLSKKVVTSTFLGVQNQASWISPKLGCVLH